MQIPESVGTLQVVLILSKAVNQLVNVSAIRLNYHRFVALSLYI